MVLQKFTNIKVSIELWKIEAKNQFIELEEMLKNILIDIRGKPGIRNNKMFNQIIIPAAYIDTLEELEQNLDDKRVLEHHVLTIYKKMKKNRNFNQGTLNMRTGSVMKTLFEFEEIRKYSWTGGSGPKRKLI